MAVADHRSKIELSIHEEDFQDFRNVSAALTAINRQLPRDFKNSVNEVAKGLVAAARVAALNEPGGKGHTGLRAKVSKGVGMIQIPNGVQITTSMPNSNEAIIPRGMDNVRGWRHPVFGRRDKWVTQRSGEDSWFMETMAKGHEPLRNRLINDINAAADKVKDAGRA
jgi:hypothetical protein